MASNPMQKKATNSFLLGFFTMLIIAALIGGILFFMNKKKEKTTTQVEQKPQVNVYVLAEDINSGADVTEDNLKLLAIDEEMKPNNAYGANNIDNFYREITDNNGELNYVPKYKAKIDLKKGTVITESMLYETEKLDKTLRTVEYNVLQLPVQIEIGNYIDVRFLLPNGQNYIVVSHKEVIDISEETIWLRLNEEEIDLMSNAIVENYIIPSSNLYVVKYVEPGMQAAATPTYVPSNEVRAAMDNNPNIVELANKELYDKYLNSQYRYRDYHRALIESEINRIEEDDRRDNIEQQMSKARESALEERQLYLNGI